MLIAVMVGIGVVFVGCGGNRTPTYEQTLGGDFRLDIEVSATSFRRGGSIEVTATFKNLSGLAHEVVYGGGRFIHPFIVGTTIDITSERRERVLEKDEVMILTFNIGDELRRGRHELLADSMFRFLVDGNESERVIVTSNTIFIRVR